MSPSNYSLRYKDKELNEYSSRLEMTIFKQDRVQYNEEFIESLEKEILKNFDYRIY